MWIGFSWLSSAYAPLTFVTTVTVRRVSWKVRVSLTIYNHWAFGLILHPCKVVSVHAMKANSLSNTWRWVVMLQSTVLQRGSVSRSYKAILILCFLYFRFQICNWKWEYSEFWNEKFQELNIFSSLEVIYFHFYVTEFVYINYRTPDDLGFIF